MNMLKKEKQRNGTAVDSAANRQLEASSPTPATPVDSAPVSKRKWTVGQQSSVASREEQTKNVICEFQPNHHHLYSRHVYRKPS